MRTILTILFISIFNSIFSQGIPKIDWQYGKLGSNLGETGIIVSDIDGDGIDEIVSTGIHTSFGFDNVSMFFTVLKYSQIENKYVVEWMSNIINLSIRSLQLYDINQDGYKEIYLGLNNGLVYVYDSRNYNKIYEFDTSHRGEVSILDTPNYVNCIAFGDIDNDSNTNIAVTNGDTTYIYSSTYKPINKIPHGAKQFEIGNIDNDPYNEIVYSNGEIIQLLNDKVINKYEYYTYNKNVKIGLSDLNNDNVKDVVYSSRDTLYVYDFKSNKLIWSQKWESDYFYYDQYITGIWLHDYDGDNIDDIFLGNEHWDDVYCYNGNNGNKDFSIKNSRGEGVVNLVVSDLDNDSNLEVIWSTGANCTCADYFFISDLSTQSKEWQSKHFVGDFKAFDIGDVDNDGELEIVSGVFGEYADYRAYGFLTVFNAESRNIEWQNDEQILGIYADDFTAIKIGDIDNDGENELLLGIDNNYPTGQIYVLNSKYEVERSFYLNGMNTILNMEIFDIDRDGQNELIVTSGTNVSGSTHPDEYQNYIYIFDGATGEMEWQSEQLAGIGSNIALLQIGNIDDDVAYEIVAMKYSQYDDYASLIIIDGNSFETIQDNSRKYTAVTIADIDNDGKDDIIAAVDNDGKDDILAAVDEGIIEVLDGTSLLSKQTLYTTCGKINTITPYDLNNDNIYELVITDKYTLSLFDIANSELKWKSDTISFNIAAYNSIKIGNIDSDEGVEIVLNANHGIFSFETVYDSIRINNPDVIYSSSKIFPNPVVNHTTIEFNLDYSTNAILKIYDIYGKEVDVKDYDNLHPGINYIEINSGNLRSGIYNVIIIAEGKIISSCKMIKTI